MSFLEFAVSWAATMLMVSLLLLILFGPPEWIKNYRITYRRNRRYVLLFACDGSCRVREAFQSDSGWIAKYWDHKDEWVILMSNGKCFGNDLIVAWLPHSGWATQQPAQPLDYKTVSGKVVR